MDVNPRGIRAVGYLRRSTDQQDRSLEDQRLAVETYARLNGLQIGDYYIDDAISGTGLRGRHGFQQMIEDARAGLKGFQSIVVYDVKRFGRMDNDETGYYRHLLRLSGVCVYYASEGFTDGFLDDLIRPVKQWQARQESKDLAKVVIRGHISKFHSRGGGWWMSGVPPWGYDRRYEDSNGQFLCHVRSLIDRSKLIMDQDGRITRTLAPGVRLPVTDQDRCRLVFSEPKRVALIRRIFFECTEHGLGCAAIARRLNNEGVATLRDQQWGRSHEGLWKYATVRLILLNPAYAGDIVWNRQTAGTFYRIAQQGAVERPLHEASTSRNNPITDWLVIRNAHQPIIRRVVFERAHELLNLRKRLHRRYSPDYRRDESDFRAQYVLTGLLKCVSCDNGFWGTRVPRTYAFRRQKPYAAQMYRCGAHHDPLCKRCRTGLIRKRVLERFITDRLVQWYQHFLNRGGIAFIRTATLEQCQKFASKTSSEKHVLQDFADMAESAIRFAQSVRKELTNENIATRRLAFRRCIDQVLVDLPKRRLVLTIHRLPILGATAGGLARSVIKLPANRRKFTLGLKKRLRVENGHFDVAWHLGRKSFAIRDLALQTREVLRTIGPDIEESIHQKYFAFSLHRHFACMKVLEKKLLVYLKLDPSTIRRRPAMFRDVTGLGTQVTGNVELTIANEGDLQIAKPFMTCAYGCVRQAAGSLFASNR